MQIGQSERHFKKSAPIGAWSVTSLPDQATNNPTGANEGSIDKKIFKSLF